MVNIHANDYHMHTSTECMSFMPRALGYYQDISQLYYRITSEHQTHANFASVDHFANIKLQNLN